MLFVNPQHNSNFHMKGMLFICVLMYKIQMIIYFSVSKNNLWCMFVAWLRNLEGFDVKL